MIIQCLFLLSLFLTGYKDTHCFILCLEHLFVTVRYSSLVFSYLSLGVKHFFGDPLSLTETLATLDMFLCYLFAFPRRSCIWKHRIFNLDLVNYTWNVVHCCVCQNLLLFWYQLCPLCGRACLLAHPLPEERRCFLGWALRGKVAFLIIGS